jgi:chemotaxis regulatin CheY-phosphate phosphatase CheZ
VSLADRLVLLVRKVHKALQDLLVDQSVRKVHKAFPAYQAAKDHKDYLACPD